MQHSQQTWSHRNEAVGLHGKYHESLHSMFEYIGADCSHKQKCVSKVKQPCCSCFSVPFVSCYSTVKLDIMVFSRKAGACLTSLSDFGV